MTNRRSSFFFARIALLSSYASNVAICFVPQNRLIGVSRPTKIVRHFTIVEDLGRTLTDEVPYDDLQKYVAWCEITGGDREERLALRRGLQREHVVWQRDCMLPSQKKQLMSVNKLAVEDEDRPDSEKRLPRILWEKSLTSSGSSFVDGMVVCVAAASNEEFEALLRSDPYLVRGVFDLIETFEWIQVNDRALRYDPMVVPHLILCKDKVNALEMRKATRSAHLNFLKASERVSLAGPLTAIGGSQPIGSLVATWGDDEDAVSKWAAEDPYVKADIFESVKIRPYTPKDVTGLYVLQNPSTSVDVDLFGLKKEDAGGDEESNSEVEGLKREEEGNEEEESGENKVDNSSFTGGFLDDLDSDDVVEQADENSEDKENLSDTLEEKPFLLDDNESADIGSLVLDDDDDEIMQD